jgi:hypothetical protein
MGLDLWSIGCNLKRFEDRNFLGEVQRRGVHVNTPETGSRGDVYCIGGILRFYAVLRREIF